MKNAFTLAALVMLGGIIVIDPVFAGADQGENTYCQSTGIADGGYIVQVAADNTTAVLQEQTFAGPRLISNMSCKQLPVDTYPDALNNYLICRDVRHVDGGLIVRMFSGGIAGLHYASVRAITVLRGKVHEHEVEYGYLNCRE